MRAVIAVVFSIFLLLFIYISVPVDTLAVVDPGGGGSPPTNTPVPRKCDHKGEFCTTSRNDCLQEPGARVISSSVAVCSNRTQTCCFQPVPTNTPTPRRCGSVRGETCTTHTACTDPDARAEGARVISGTSGCGGSTPTCCYYPPPPAPTNTPVPRPNHECFVPEDCPSGEYCSKRSTGNVCLPISGGTGNQACPHECSLPAVGCLSGERCFNDGGCYTCQPSDEACRSDFYGDFGSCTNINSCESSTIIESVRCVDSSNVCCISEGACKSDPNSRNREGCGCYNSTADGTVVNVGCSSGLECYSGPKICADGSCSSYIGYGTSDYSSPYYARKYQIYDSGYRKIVGYQNLSDFYGTCTPSGGGARGSGGTYYITGTIYVDSNSNNKKDSGDTVYRPPSGGQGATVRLTRPSINLSDVTNENGVYFFYNNPAGTYTVTLSVPQGYRNVIGTVRSVTIVRANVRSIDFLIAPTYTVSGSVFEDANANGIKDNGEVNYTKGNIAVTSNSGTVSKPPGAGTYTVTDVFKGTYVISFTPPAGYFMSPSKPSQFQVTVGPSCVIDPDVNGVSGAVCSNDSHGTNGNVTNLNFGIRTYVGWMQTYGFDVRFDSGYTNIIPANPAYPPYAANVDTH